MPLLLRPWRRRRVPFVTLISSHGVLRPSSHGVPRTRVTRVGDEGDGGMLSNIDNIMSGDAGVLLILEMGVSSDETI